ncbi:MAG: HDOD domain-containing protein [Granulosicoccus sp.]
MTTIILADSDDAARAELLDSLRSAKPDWRFISLSSGIDVLQHVGDDLSSCIITEADLHDMSGFELLSKLQANYPEIVRITFSADIDNEAISESTCINHRFVNRTLPIDVLISTIEGSMKLQALLSSDSLIRSMNDVSSLPSLPEIYQQMVSELTSEQSSLLNVARIIETDSALTATVLKIVNSAFYGLSQRIESVSQGVALLGVHLIKNVTLTAKVFSQFDGDAKQLKQLRMLNDSANRNGALTNQLARLAKVPRKVVDYAQIAGMLSNIGQLIVLCKESDAAADPTEPNVELQGAYLLKLWLLPDPVVEAVALQHDSPPQPTSTITPLVILHAIRYMQTQFQELSNDSQRQTIQTYLEQMVSPEIASQWIDAYCDVNALTAHTDLDQSRVA